MALRMLPQRETESSIPRRQMSHAALQRASRRLGMGAAMLAAIYLLSIAIGVAAYMAGAIPASEVLHTLCFGMLWFPASLGLFAASRSHRFAPTTVLKLGLAYEVLLSLLLSIVEWWGPASDRPFRGISWVCLLIVAFPFFIPLTPRKNLYAALAAATTGPVVAAVVAMLGLPMPQPHQVVMYYVTNYFCAVGSFLLANAIWRLQHQGGSQGQRDMGSYRLLERLSNGGMGEVWRAHHRLLERPAAVKLIRPEVLNSDNPDSLRVLTKRFEREARATAALRSPHTVELYDFGIATDGTVYYAMELLDGIDLASLVEGYGLVPANRVVHLLKQACLSLTDAHEAGLVHRDVKPANLFLSKMGSEFDYLKVLDFGLVIWHANPVVGTATTKLTRANVIQGTPAFMAPEIAAQDEDIDGRADLYALGCVGYWLLTGRWVFEDASPMRLLLQHMQSEPPPPSTRSSVAVPPALEHVIMSCLAKKPQHRPESARHLRILLEEVENDLDNPWTPQHAELWWMQNGLSRPSLPVPDPMRPPSISQWRWPQRESRRLTAASNLASRWKA